MTGIMMTGPPLGCDQREGGRRAWANDNDDSVDENDYDHDDKDNDDRFPTGMWSTRWLTKELRITLSTLTIVETLS